MALRHYDGVMIWRNAKRRKARRGKPNVLQGKGLDQGSRLLPLQHQLHPKKLQHQLQPRRIHLNHLNRKVLKAVSAKASGKGCPSLSDPHVLSVPGLAPVKTYRRVWTPAE